ncbi:hypothetical protein M2R29_18105 [Aeromonas hydrophila]|uniref:hypothetical protein n=1 Tax=Aeromonas hydrophila TaxID=644 RepID=UPI00207D443C|nr:hypothetical protein [Aeromonas hydrophila]MCO4209859.1 hypothetical protein [Aeromonas hydrophila]
MQHEQSFADIFNRYMNRQALMRGCAFYSFSLDGQDRDIGADYLLTNSDRFSIVEFKYMEKDLTSENRKTKRLVLCKKLEKNFTMESYHDSCHFISWSDKDSGEVVTNVYRHEICNQSVFGESCGLKDKLPQVDKRISLKLFSEKFFSHFNEMSLSREDFEEYVEWVLRDTSGSTKSQLQLIAFNPDSDSIALVKINSLTEAQQWVNDHFTPPSSSFRP